MGIERAFGIGNLYIDLSNLPSSTNITKDSESWLLSDYQEKEKPTYQNSSH
tara:strand:+ start:3860 stop:4012 length:153 start_codon:yes stop_codon:yes gene_type:complete